MDLKHNMNWVKGAFLLLSLSRLTAAQISDQEKYRNQVLRHIDSLIQYQEQLILKQDTTAMRAFYPDDMIITNPFGQMIGKEKMIERVKSGIIQYSKYEKNIEHFAMEGDKVAIVVGKERVTPTLDANRADAGKPHERRFTEVWVLRSGRWQRLIRHASTFSAQ
jgi:ketosteroid isomerase-like protein